MSTYEAWIKVPIGATRDEAESLVRMGLHETAARLVDELGCDPSDVREWLEEAAEAADEAGA